MQIVSLHADGFRNLLPLQLDPGPRFNVISGDNGHGKTNLLEALYVVGTLRSFRSARLAELVGWGATHARVAARVLRAGMEHVYDVDVVNDRKQVKLDGKTPRTAGEYFAELNMVLFAPEDLRILRGSPGGRRRFLDRSVFNRNVTFLDDAQRYARVLKTRNALLRNGTSNTDLTAVYDAQLVAHGARVVAARVAYLDAFAPFVQKAFAAITGGSLTATLSYEAPEAVLAAKADVAALEDALRAELAASRRREVARGQTLVGPHVDDLAFFLDGHEARTYASQGQLRALVLAWKTAEMGFLAAARGDTPVLLLDDVSSELDPERTRFLFDFLVSLAAQCFVTTTDPSYVLADKNRQDFRMVAGRLSPL